MTSGALVTALQTLLEETLGAVRRNTASGALQLSSIVCSAYSEDPVLFGGGGANLLHADRPLPEQVTFTFKGRIDLPAGEAGPVQLRATADLLDNPQLIGRVDTILPVSEHGLFSHDLTLIFNSPTPRVLKFEARLIGPAAVLAVQPVEVVLADLEGFLAQIEPFTPATPTIDFLTAVRRVVFTNPLFDLAISRGRGVKPLLPKGSRESEKLKAHKALLAGGRLVDISHVIIGIEGADRFDPRPLVPIPRVDLVLTWSGDLGSVVQKWIWDTYYLQEPGAGSLEKYLTKYASVHGMIGDIDAVNLAASYREDLSLTDNLRRYYEQDADDRFRLFLANTRRDDGTVALALEPGGTPRLTAESRAFIAQKSADFALYGLLQALISTPRFKDKNFLPEPARLALQVDSPEFQRVTTYFVDLLEQGLR